MTAATPNTITKGRPVWSLRKNKARAEQQFPVHPTQHRAARTHPATVPFAAVAPVLARTRGHAEGLEPVAYDWLLNDADRLDDGALDAEGKAARLLRDAAEWRTVAASYRHLAAAHTPHAPRPEPQPLAQPEPAYDEPQPAADPDLSRFNPTWQVPDGPQTAACGCRWWRGESCATCDTLTPTRVSVITPWSPTSEPDAAGWRDEPRDGATEQFPAVNGDNR